jgi:hypothetical protein
MFEHGFSVDSHLLLAGKRAASPQKPSLKGLSDNRQNINRPEKKATAPTLDKPRN